MVEKKSDIDEFKTPVKGHLYTKGEESVTEHVLPEICHMTHGIASDVNLRTGHNRYNYDAHRPYDKLPVEHAEIIIACQAVYRKIGMVRNVIDMMTDFASEGLELQHPVKTQERFFREWARRVNLAGRAHDFMKLLMRDGNVIVRCKCAFITKPVIKEMTKGIINTVDETLVKDLPEKIKIIKKRVNRREIPWRYTFLSPVIIEKIGGEVGRFFGDDSLGMRIPLSLANSIRNPRTEAEKSFVTKLPPEIVRAVKKNSKLVALDMDKIYVDYYKKDDWEDWGTPFLYGILEDIMFKAKMRLADMAALDGVINVIRLWKLGKSDQQILPTAAAVDKLINILQHNTGGGVMDLVWDDMIDLQIDYPPTDKILGAEKYSGVNTDIVQGLGIPNSLIGGTDLGTRNAQSAFVQLKTLVERLEYVRSRAIRWMEGELRLVADAMGFKKIPVINFGNMSLRDEAAEKQLIIQLLDRGIISSERASETFGTNFMIELERIKSEQQIRKNNPGVLEKANPYYRPFSVMEKQNELTIELESIKQGFNNNEVSMDDDNGGGDNPMGDPPKDGGNNPSGRPPSTRDTGPRDQRTPKTLSILSIVGEGFLDRIDQFADATYLKQHNVKNMRFLTKVQRTELENVKRGMLSTLRPQDKVTKKLIAERLKTAGKDFNCMENIFNQLMVKFRTSTKRIPTIKEYKLLVGLAWSMMIKEINSD